MLELKALLLTQGMHGMLSQVEGLAKALKLSFKHHKIKLKPYVVSFEEDMKMFLLEMRLFFTEVWSSEHVKTLENVVSFPHLGSATIETRIAMGDTAINNALAFFEGKDLPNKVV